MAYPFGAYAGRNNGNVWHKVNGVSNNVPNIGK